MDYRYVHHLTEEMKEILRSSGVKLPLLAPMHHGQASHLVKSLLSGADLPTLTPMHNGHSYLHPQGICSELDDESAIRICDSYQEKVATSWLCGHNHRHHHYDYEHHHNQAIWHLLLKIIITTVIIMTLVMTMATMTILTTRWRVPPATPTSFLQTQTPQVRAVSPHLWSSMGWLCWCWWWWYPTNPLVLADSPIQWVLITHFCRC